MTSRLHGEDITEHHPGLHPMLRRLDRLRPWNCSEYVCVTCRHQLWAAQSQRARRKYHQTLLRRAQSEVDSWEDNFNNLDAGLGPSKPEAPAEKSKHASSDDVGSGKKTGGNKSVAASRIKARRSRGKDGAMRSSVKREGRGQQDVGVDGLLSSLDERMAGGSGKDTTRQNNTTSTSQGKTRVIASKSAGIDDSKQRPRPAAASAEHSSAEAAMYAKYEDVVKKLEQDMTPEAADTSIAHDLLRLRATARYRRGDDGLLRKRNKREPLGQEAVSDAPETGRGLDPLIRRGVGLKGPAFYEERTSANGSTGGEASSKVSPAGQQPNGAPSSTVSSDATSNAESPPQSTARLTFSDWLTSKILPGSRPSQSIDPPSPVEEGSSAPARTTPKGLPFGAQTAEPQGAEVRAPGSLDLTMSTPAFGVQTPSSQASDALAKLYTSGWNLSAGNDDTAASAAASKKGKSTKKPAATSSKTTNGKNPVVTKGLNRRERAKLQQQSKSDADKDKSASKGKGKKSKRSTSADQQALSEQELGSMSSVKPQDLAITPLEIPQPPVPSLEYGLDRVLFNPGVYQLQDPHSRVYNFDPYLQMIMPVVEFDFNALKEYKTSSQDVALGELAKSHGKRYIGSTSSMTGTLAHFHYLLSAFRPLNTNMVSRGFPDQLDSFTAINRAPNAIFLRWKNGTYAIDADKEHDSPNVLMMLGKSMEKLLTLPTSEFERYRKTDPRSVSEEDRTAPEAFQYTTMGDFLMRSQLDAYDPRLPGTGMFDLKTRAVVTVRMDTTDFEPMTGYQIHTLQGRFESYEREYYDMIRSTMLKYMLQVRMGRMDGIFIAFHNVERIFGFQYVSLQDMDRALHGTINTCLGDQEFKASLDMLNKVFDMATKKFPEQSLRFHFQATPEKLDSDATVMWVFAEPMGEAQIESIQSSSKARVAEFEREMLGYEKEETPDTDAVVTESEEADAKWSTAASTQVDTTETPEPKPASSSTTSNDSKSSDDLAPLFAASILCESKVNGKTVTRPERLRPTDKWEIDYIAHEYPTDAKMWARYEQMKARRKEIFSKYDEDDVEDAPSSKEESRKKAKGREYIEFMKRLSEQGRAFRVKADEAEKGSEPVVVGRPVARGGERVEGVEDYMGWLYKKR
ncbi:uncharacterized protein LTR77_008413 [Saxophila tyrrhenica]|uniref:Uncharacterized protein n=1 Tax=Saxophila tyrrhenica TaxID=1690608 RepID=A0AAV9P3S9_9PEZI|nr:hypothetical protein LTR77_008413 [Saxophila tyrrhenica]